MARRTKRKSARAKKTQPRQWGRRPASMTNASQFRKLMQWSLPDDGIFANLKRHGNTSWLPRGLVWLALCWSWSQNRFVTDAFTDAVEWCRTLVGSAALTTYQGFMGALVR